MEQRPGVAALIGAAVFLISVSLSEPVFAQGGAEGSRTITVTGTGTAYGAPDMAVVELGVDTRGAELKAALSDAEARMSKVTDSLRASGISRTDIATTQYSVSFVPGRVESGGARATSQGYYEVVDMASITIRAIGNTASALDAATKAGANRIDGIRFEISDPWKEEALALDKAYAQAHERALRIAKLAGITLGPVRSASEQGSPRPEAGPVFRAEALAAPPVSPGSQGITVTLNVVYAIR